MTTAVAAVRDPTAAWAPVACGSAFAMQPRLNEPISQAGSVHAQVTGGPDAGRADVDGEHRRSSHMATFRRWLRQDPSHNRLLRSHELAIAPTTNSANDHPCINR